MKSPSFFTKILISWYIALLLPLCSPGQNNLGFFTPAPTQDNNRLIPLVATQGVLYAGSMIGLNVLWYKNYAHSSFHLFNDNKEWQQMDKLGHILTAYTISRLTSALYVWCGLRERPSNAYGAAVGLGYQTNIEIFDGFSSAWGFSLGDMTANTIGAALFISQQAAWGDQRITLKISFHPTDYSQYRPDELGNNFIEESLKDYNGQTYWVAVAIASFFPKGTKIPQWACIDFGYGAEGMTGAMSNPVTYDQNGNEVTFDRYRQVYCSLDVDLTKIPTSSGALKAVFGAVSFIKIPMPTLEFSKHKFKFHILYF